MPQMLQLALALRLGAVIVFVIAIIAAGAMNRHVLVIPLMAAAMTFVRVFASQGTDAFMRRMRPGPAADTLPPASAAPANATPFRATLSRAPSIFVNRLVVMTVMFFFTVLIAAIFRETDLARQFTLTDALVVAIPLAAALVLTQISQRMTAGATEALAGLMSELHARANPDAAAPPSAANDDTIIDGEFHAIDPEDDPRPPRN